MTQIFGIFEGGGAMGISHVGALKAAEDEGLEFVGVAGASAGAIIATLIAIGYKADQIFNPAIPGGDILTQNQCSPVIMIGEKPWKNFSAAMPQIGRLMANLYILGVAAAKCFASRPLSLASEVVTNLGYFDSEAMREAINRIIRAKVRTHVAGRGENPDNVPQWVRFKDIDPTENEECCRLKIMATDVLNKCPVIFSNSTPNVIVADAVVASISIPFVFPPVSVRQSTDQNANELIPYESEVNRFVDGGLVSNLPTWVFADEKGVLERDTQCRIPLLAFELVMANDPENGNEPDNEHGDEHQPNGWDDEGSNIKRFTEYCSAIGNTAVFGNQKIVEKFIADLQVIQVRSPLRTLQLDCSWDQARTAHRSGYETAKYQLVAQRKERELAGRFLERLAREARVRINGIRSEKGLEEIGNLRTCTVKVIGDSSFQVSHSSNMVEDADDFLVIDGRNAAAPLAFARKEPTFLDIRKKGRQSLYMTKYERALVRPALRSVISVPVLSDLEEWSKDREYRSTPVAVLCIDSDSDLSGEFKNSDFLTWLSEQSVVFSAILKQGVNNE